MKPNDDILNFDFGGIDTGATDGIDLNLFDVTGGDDGVNPADLESRYIKPKLPTFPREFVKYEYAEDLAKAVDLVAHPRYDVLCAGSFVFGDFIEAFVTHNNALIEEMTITTLSLNQNNVDSLRNLIEWGYLKKLTLIVSAYFYANEHRQLIPYIYRELDVEACDFQLAAAGVHTKTVTMLTGGGKKIVMTGSANLRSSANVEQFSIELNADAYDFYHDFAAKIADKYKTINKAIRVKPLWDELTKKRFND